ncbi:MAG: ABC transporter permease [Bacteroidetes bacterium]|nr:ABC transporter permease [Bacteroidota bacterium]
MLKNYLKIAFRNLVRNKTYTLLNVLGLTIGISACLLIFLVIQFETSYDNFHPKKNSIYRLGTEFQSQDGVGYSAGVSFPVGPQLRLDFPQIKEVTSIFKLGDRQITLENGSSNQQRKLKETNIYYTEPEFFKMFNFGWIAGNPSSSLSEPNQAVLTQATAEKYFGDWKSAIGKTVQVDNNYIFKITGILKNFPPNTDFPLNMALSYSSLKNSNLSRNMTDWVSTFSAASVYVVLPPEYSMQKFNTDLKSFARKHKPAEYGKDAYISQPLKEIHYDERFGNYNDHTFPHSLITALILIGIFLLLIACVNFINLATAQAVNRSKEVGIRKVLGSVRGQLAFQFLGETGLITLAAIACAIFVTAISLPFLNTLLETKMPLQFIGNPTVILFLITVLIAVTILSGLYPALIISRFNPITALKNKVTAKMIGGISLRRVLVILQFAIAHVLIIGMLIVVSQMDFFKNASLGFDKTAVINVPVPGDSAGLKQYAYLRNKLLENPDIMNVSFSFGSPSSNGNWSSDFKFDNSSKATDFSANLKWADEDYFKTYNLKFVAGRPYHQNDTVNEFVVNETLLHKLGITDPQKAIGKKINLWDGQKVFPIVGVIRDFNSYSLRSPMAPVMLGTWKSTYETINIKIKPGTEKNTLAYIEKYWNESFPKYVYQYQFLDQTIANFYKQETQLTQLYKIFAGIAIFISCLGLYGLVSFMAVQRTKEMGIRKVLGATAVNIVYLLSREFTFLILIAFVIAGPIAYFIMRRWLDNYTYRIPLGASIFFVAIFSSIVIAWITVGYRAIRTALTNPVTSLRTE